MRLYTRVKPPRICATCMTQLRYLRIEYTWSSLEEVLCDKTRDFVIIILSAPVTHLSTLYNRILEEN